MNFCIIENRTQHQYNLTSCSLHTNVTETYYGKHFGKCFTYFGENAHSVQLNSESRVEIQFNVQNYLKLLNPEGDYRVLRFSMQTHSAQLSIMYLFKTLLVSLHYLPREGPMSEQINILLNLQIL